MLSYIYKRAKTHKQNGTDGFGGVRHVDGSIVADHLRHVGQGTTVIQVEVTETAFNLIINDKMNICMDVIIHTLSLT